MYSPFFNINVVIKEECWKMYSPFFNINVVIKEGCCRMWIELWVPYFFRSHQQSNILGNVYWVLPQTRIIFATRCRRPLIFQTMTSVWSPSLRLKYQRVSSSCCTYLGISTFEWVCGKDSLTFSFSCLDIWKNDNFCFRCILHMMWQLYISIYLSGE